ncbi:MAG: esterase-like activity of phytase family protein, partial [Rhodospirillales bacterium]
MLLRLFLLIALMASAAPAGASEPLALSTRPVPLDHADWDRKTVGRLIYRGGLELDSEDERFGGLSGLALTGDRLTAVSDQGHWIEARLSRDGNGRPSGLSDARIGHLTSLDGQPLVAKGLRDAEEILRLDDGSFLVSFERLHRVHRYSKDLDNPRPLNVPEEVSKARSNGGIEAMADLGGGLILLLCEDYPTDGTSSIGWVGREGEWRQIRYPHHETFKPTGAV